MSMLHGFVRKLGRYVKRIKLRGRVLGIKEQRVRG